MLKSKKFVKSLLINIFVAGMVGACSSSDSSDDKKSTALKLPCKLKTPGEGQGAMCYSALKGKDKTEFNDTKANEMMNAFVTDKGIIKIAFINYPNNYILIQAKGDKAGSFELYQLFGDSSYYLAGKDIYSQATRSDKDGGKLTIAKYAANVGDSMEGTFEAKLCKYIAGKGTDCDNIYEIKGSFNVKRTDRAPRSLLRLAASGNGVPSGGARP